MINNPTAVFYFSCTNSKGMADILLNCRIKLLRNVGQLDSSSFTNAWYARNIASAYCSNSFGATDFWTACCSVYHTSFCSSTNWSEISFERNMFCSAERMLNPASDRNDKALRAVICPLYVILLLGILSEKIYCFHEIILIHWWLSLNMILKFYI